MTDAKELYLRQHEAFLANGGSVAPEWVQQVRRAAIARFGEVGFPTVKEEAWRFTSVDGLTRQEFTRAPSGATPDAARVDEYLIGDGESRIVALTVNGRYVPPSRLPALPPDVIVTGLSAAVDEHADLLQEHVAKHAGRDGSPFAALGTAFIDDGVFVYVPKNVVLDQPVQIVHYTVAGSDRVVTHPRTLVFVEQGAQATFIETYAGDDDTLYWTNAITEYVIAENAVVDAYRVQRESGQAFHTAASHSYQGRSSVYSWSAFAFGSALTRNDVRAVLNGEGAEATLNGLTVITDRQHVDYHTTIDHAQPHCNSWELFNGVFDERSRGVFTGRIIVRPGAQKTDAKQTNNNLLLSKQARADSQPQLEIYADDVKCTHGATLGPIDEAAMFYLRSRGLGEVEARNLLTYGFGAEVLNSVSIEELRERLDALVHARLER